MDSINEGFLDFFKSKNVDFIYDTSLVYYIAPADGVDISNKPFSKGDIFYFIEYEDITPNQRVSDFIGANFKNPQIIERFLINYYHDLISFNSYTNSGQVYRVTPSGRGGYDAEQIQPATNVVRSSNISPANIAVALTNNAYNKIDDIVFTNNNINRYQTRIYYLLGDGGLYKIQCELFDEDIVGESPFYSFGANTTTARKLADKKEQNVVISIFSKLTQPEIREISKFRAVNNHNIVDPSSSVDSMSYIDFVKLIATTNAKEQKTFNKNLRPGNPLFDAITSDLPQEVGDAFKKFGFSSNISDKLIGVEDEKKTYDVLFKFTADKNKQFFAMGRLIGLPMDGISPSGGTPTTAYDPSKEYKDIFEQEFKLKSKVSVLVGDSQIKFYKIKIDKKTSTQRYIFVLEGLEPNLGYNSQQLNLAVKVSDPTNDALLVMLTSNSNSPNLVKIVEQELVVNL